MQHKKRFIALLSVGLLLLATAFGVTYFFPSDGEPESHRAEYFPIKDPETGKWGFIDNQGNPTTAMVLEWAGDYRMGRGLAQSNGMMGYIGDDFNETGEWAISPRFVLRDENDMPASGFFDGLALVRDDSGKWGYIDRSGKWAIEAQFIENDDYAGVPAGDFSDGLAWFQTVEMSEKYQMDSNDDMVRDAEGKPVKVRYPKLTMGFIDLKGKVVIEASYQMVNDFGEGLAGVRIKTNGKWGFIDKEDKRVIPPEFDGVGRFSEGLCAALKGERWGYIDKEGEWAIEPQFAEVRQFLEGLAPARKGELWGYIDKEGQWAIEPAYDNFDDYPGEPRSFENGLASVTLEGQRIYIDTEGNQVWPKKED